MVRGEGDHSHREKTAGSFRKHSFVQQKGFDKQCDLAKCVPIVWVLKIWEVGFAVTGCRPLRVILGLWSLFFLALLPG